MFHLKDNNGIHFKDCSHHVEWDINNDELQLMDKEYTKTQTVTGVTDVLCCTSIADATINPLVLHNVTNKDSNHAV